MACASAVAGISVPYLLPESENPKQLGLYFHGDLGGAHNRIPSSSYLEFAYKNNILFMAPVSPIIGSNGKEQWSDHQRADDVAEMILAFAEAYNTPTDKVLFSSASGGSTYLTNEFIPKAGDQVQGTFALACGASQPSGGVFSWDTNNTGIKDKIKIFYYYTPGDFLEDAIVESNTFYSGLGFSTDSEEDMTGMGHCGGDWSGFGFIKMTWENNKIP